MKLASFERTRTMALLFRFLRTAMSVGRMPSLVGREVFRARVGARPAAAFENAVLFVCDVEKCLSELDPLEQRLIAYCVLENRSEWEASRQFQASQGFISRHLGHALDILHATFCQRGILPPLPEGMQSQESFSNAIETDLRRKS
ncbi:MAG TPA: hypothetical protein VGQ11_03575 [Candidatus Acidoferrales bacterium]|jgi:hypothetical protein|nr:hypothetical protein [Candidatus Acidoferrales bacterium]